MEARAEEMKQAVRASGAQVVGDLGDLDPVFSDKGAQPGEVTDAALLEAALEGLVGLGRDRARLKRRLQAAHEVVPEDRSFRARFFVDGEPRPGFGVPISVYRKVRALARVGGGKN